MGNVKFHASLNLWREIIKIKRLVWLGISPKSSQIYFQRKTKHTLFEWAEQSINLKLLGIAEAKFKMYAE